jgi:hypothetical protein
LKAEEKLARKQSWKFKGIGSTRSKGQSSGRGAFHTPRDEGGSPNSRGGESRGRIFFPRGRDRGGREIKCYTCGNIGHMSWDCPKNKSAGQRNANVAETKEEIVNTNTKEEVLEVGESLLMNRVLLK